MNILMLLEMAAEACGDRTAFKDASNSQSISYRGLFKASEEKAKVLRESGASRCALIDTANLTIPVALFASSWVGIPYVPINYRLTSDEIDSLLERIKPAFLITDESRIGNFEKHELAALHDRHSFREVRAKSREAAEPWSMDPEDVAALLFTSGTTGAPKAAVMRQKHLVSYILQSVEFLSAEESESTLVSVPPYHIAGIASVISSVYAGRRVVQLSQFTPENWLKVAHEEKVTTAFVVPTMLSRIVDSLEGAKSAALPLLQSISYGGGRMPHAVIERAMKLFPDTDFTNAYGLTETSSTISVLGPDEHRAAVASDDPKERSRLASAGVALPGIEIDIRDDDGNSVGPNVHGEVFVRGEQVSGEYEGRDSAVNSDGWFPTRDAGYIDEGGYLYLDGRADDIIVRGGENLSPGEIEEVLRDHPAVHDAGVFGIPSMEWGEAVAAVVVTDAEVDEATLKDWVLHHTRSSRVPETIEIWDELPYIETGKLLRRVIRRSFHAD